MDAFFKQNSYVAGGYDTPDGFVKLDQAIKALETKQKANRLFYLALPPTVFDTVTLNIKERCMAKE